MLHAVTSNFVFFYVHQKVFIFLLVCLSVSKIDEKFWLNFCAILVG